MNRRIADTLKAKGLTQWRLLVTYGGPAGHEETRELLPKRGRYWSYIGATRRAGAEWRAPPEGLWVIRTEYLAITEGEA